MRAEEKEGEIDKTNLEVEPILQVDTGLRRNGTTITTLVNYLLGWKRRIGRRRGGVVCYVKL